MAIRNVLKTKRVYIKERMNCSEYRLRQKFLLETVAYVFTDIPFIANHSPYFFKKIA